MEKIKIVAFVGKSGAGKNYLARDYANTCKGHIIVPSTTRPKRDYEVDGEDYHFLTDAEFAAATFMETATFNNWFYGTRLGDLRLDCINVGSFSPVAVKQLATHDNVELTVVYVKASAKTRLLRQLNREEDPNVREIIRRFGTDEEDFSDTEWFRTIGDKYAEVWNDHSLGRE